MSMHGLPSIIATLGATVTDVRLSPGTLVGGTAYSTTPVDGMLVFFDKPAAEVVLGTTVPNYFIPLLGLSSNNLCRAGEGVIFRNAISVAAVDALMGTAARISNLAFVIS